MDTSSQPWLASAFQRLLRPLVGIALRNGVMYREFASWCKHAYVDVAASEYGKGGRPTNQSRIALMTGIDRKQIKRLREDTAAGAGDAERRASRPGHLSRVLTEWFTDPRYLQGDGSPAPLTRSRLLALCERVGGDIAPSAAARELLDSGTLRREGDHYSPARRYYMPQQAEPDALTRSADVIADLTTTVSHNLYRPEGTPSRFEGRATNLNVGEDVLPEFRTFVERRGQKFLEDIDLWLTEREANRDPDRPTLRLGVGAYWLQGKAERGS